MLGPALAGTAAEGKLGSRIVAMVQLEVYSFHLNRSTVVAAAEPEDAVVFEAVPAGIAHKKVGAGRVVQEELGTLG